MFRKYSFSAIVLALMFWFGCRAFEGANGGAPLDPDASRHMMNGAFLYDMARLGRVMHPVQFAHTWYAQLPVLSLPYHPPVFPLVEAVFYAVFGVHYWVARLCIALAVALCVFLTARLAIATRQPPLIAIATVLILFSAPAANWLAHDVMLEFPALVPNLIALLLLRDLAFEDRFTWWRALMFSLAASLAIWTKQDAVFLLGVPWIILTLNRSWGVLRSGAIWVSTCIVGASFGLLMAVPAFYKVGSNHRWRYRPLFVRVQDHASLYFHAFIGQWGWTGVLLLVAAGIYIVQVKRRDFSSLRAANFYLAWITAALLLRLIMQPRDPRYAFSWEPALILFVLSMLVRLPGRWTGAAALAAATLFFAMRITAPVPYLHGFDAAAQAAIVHGRIVSFVPNDGAFVAAIRAAEPSLETTVIRGDKISPSDISDDFFHRFGVMRIITVDSTAPWNKTRLRAEFPIQSSDAKQGRIVRVYDYLNPSEHPDNVLDVISSFSVKGLHLVLP